MYYKLTYSIQHSISIEKMIKIKKIKLNRHPRSIKYICIIDAWEIESWILLYFSELPSAISTFRFNYTYLICFDAPASIILIRIDEFQIKNLSEQNTQKKAYNDDDEKKTCPKKLCQFDVVTLLVNFSSKIGECTTTTMMTRKKIMNPLRQQKKVNIELKNEKYIQYIGTHTHPKTQSFELETF